MLKERVSDIAVRPKQNEPAAESGALDGAKSSNSLVRSSVDFVRQLKTYERVIPLFYGQLIILWRITWNTKWREMAAL
jgi:hypothetical protein